MMVGKMLAWRHPPWIHGYLSLRVIAERALSWTRRKARDLENCEVRIPQLVYSKRHSVDALDYRKPVQTRGSGLLRATGRQLDRD